MIEHVFSVLCNGTSIDAETNSISLFKVLEQLTVFSETTEPVRLLIHFEIVSFWTRQSTDIPGRGRMRFTFCSPSNQQKQGVELDVDLSKSINHRTRIISDSIELTGPGKYQFIIELQEGDHPDWQKVASVPLLVNYQPATSA
jgi:hypothetical protein